MIGRLRSFWKGIFSGAMIGRVKDAYFCEKTQLMDSFYLKCLSHRRIPYQSLHFFLVGIGAHFSADVSGCCKRWLVAYTHPIGRIHPLYTIYYTAF